MLKFCLDRYRIQEMCDEAVNDFLPALKFVSGWFVKNEMLEKVDNFVSSNDGIDLDNIVRLFSDDIGLNTLDLKNINLDDCNYYYYDDNDDNDDHDDPESIICLRLMA